MKVSIIVPVYKIKESYLRKCIESLIQQTLEDIEIILIDDGSPDNCGEICDEYQAHHENISVIHQENLGVSAARNAGMSKALGEYIMFVDSDDFLINDACERSYFYARQLSAEILLFRHKSSYNKKYNTDSEKISEEKNLSQLQLETLDRNRKGSYDMYSLGASWGKIFLSKFLKDNTLTYKVGLKKAQDRLFMLYCYQNCHKVYFLDYQGYFYNYNEESICNEYNKSIEKIGQQMIDSFKNFVEVSHKDEEEYLKALQYLKVNIMFEMIYLDYFHPKNKKNFFNRYLEFKKALNRNGFKNAISKVNKKKYGYKEAFFLLLLNLDCIFIAGTLLESHRIKKEIKLIANRTLF